MEKGTIAYIKEFSMLNNFVRKYCCTDALLQQQKIHAFTDVFTDEL